MLYLPLFLRGKNRKYTISIVAGDKWLPNLKELLQMGVTFLLVMISWVFFRSESVKSAFIYLFKMILEIGIPSTNRSGVIFVFLLLIFDWSMRKNEKTPLNFSNVYIRRFSYIILGYAIIAHFQFIDLTQFLYFQF